MDNLKRYGILHPTKGIVGFKRNKPFYPNEKEPLDIDEEKSFISADPATQLEKLQKFPDLQSQGCTVVEITTTFSLEEFNP